MSCRFTDVIGYVLNLDKWRPVYEDKASWFAAVVVDHPESVMFCTTEEEAYAELLQRTPSPEGFTRVVAQHGGKFKIIKTPLFTGSLAEAAKLAKTSKRGVVPLLAGASAHRWRRIHSMPEKLSCKMSKDFRIIDTHNDYLQLRYEKDWKSKREARLRKRRAAEHMKPSEFAAVTNALDGSILGHSLWKLGPASRKLSTCMNCFLVAIQLVQADHGVNAYWSCDEFRTFIAEWKRRYAPNQVLKLHHGPLVTWLNEQCSFKKWPRKSKKLDRSLASIAGRKPRPRT